MSDPLRNPKDPLNKSGPEAGRELFRAFAREANGFPREAALDAAVNIILNVIRQSNDKAGEAEAQFNELFGKTKSLLLDHYDSLGRKRGIFPYTQHVNVPLLNFKSKPH